MCYYCFVLFFNVRISLFTGCALQIVSKIVPYFGIKYRLSNAKMNLKLVNVAIVVFDCEFVRFAVHSSNVHSI